MPKARRKAKLDPRQQVFQFTEHDVGGQTFHVSVTLQAAKALGLVEAPKKEVPREEVLRKAARWLGYMTREFTKKELEEACRKAFTDGGQVQKLSTVLHGILYHAANHAFKGGFKPSGH